MKYTSRALRAASSALGLACLFVLPASAQGSDSAWSRLTARAGPGLELVRADATGVEIRGAARAAGALPDSAAVETASLEILAAAEELLGVPRAQFARVFSNRVAGVEVIQFEQRAHGLPIRGSFAELAWTADGTLTSMRARGLSPAVQRDEFVVVREDAAELARLSAPALDTRVVWALPPVRALLPLDGVLRPVWSVVVWNPSNPAEEWHVLVDGVDGAVRECRRSVVEGLAGFVDGRARPTASLISGPPAVLPMANIEVSAIDRSVVLLRITDNACGDVEVAMSSDGLRVAWISACDGDGELWTASSDGTGMVQLTSNATSERSPTMSSDGTRIVFVSNAGGDDELWSIQSNGTGLTQLTSNTTPDHSPSISGDGTRVAYISEAGGDAELATLLVAAPTPVLLTTDTTLDASPRIALDGSRIVWVSSSDGDADVCTITPAGGSFVRVTLNAVEDGEPDIRADGTRIVFTSRAALDAPLPGDPSATPFVGLAGPHASERGRAERRRLAARDLFEASSDGSALVRLTESEADERGPSYATAGGCVAYVSDEDGDAEIELLDIAGGTLMQLTDDDSKDLGPRASSTCGRGAWVANDGDGEIFVWNLTELGLAYTDTTGFYSMPWTDGRTPTASTRLRGRYVSVRDLDPRWADVRAKTTALTPTVFADLLLNPTGAVEGPTAQVTAYYHANRAHDELATVLLRPPLSLASPLAIDARLKVRANFPEVVANAFYSSVERAATFFIGGGALRPNTACDTVILHEYGHYFDDMFGGLSAGSACEAPIALSEGIADTLAMYVTAQTLIGEDFFGIGTWIRDYSRPYWLGAAATGAQQYGCETCPPSGGAPEVHEHGAAFAGFAWDLRAALGAVTAEDLIFGALTGNPPDMQSAVNAVFSLAALPAFGGSGDPTTSPLNGVICAAAARHGFDCFTRPDLGSWGCFVGVCADAAIHRTIGTEWLGMVVDGEGACETTPNPDDDGLFFPPAVMSGETKLVTITLKVDPAMKASGRYGAPLPHMQIPKRRVFLNAWMFVDDGAGGIDEYKVLGTGSSSPTIGPDTIGLGNTVAFNPDTWAGTSLAFPCTLKIPVVPTPRVSILRVRVDYGEDAGFHETCLSHSTLDGPCGVARYGEVEDYQTTIMP